MTIRFGNRNYGNKYRATKTADGFGSKLEAAVYTKLLDREKLGLIRDIKRQQTVVLIPGGRGERVTWRVDFSFEERHLLESEGEANWAWKLAYAEAKGFETRDYVIKLKLWRYMPPAPLEIWKGNYRSPKLVERIEAKQPLERAE